MCHSLSGPGTAPAQSISKGLAELEAPVSDGLVGESEAAHCHDLFDVAKAQSETEVKPHCVADDSGGETMTAVERSGCVHQRSMPHVRICRTLASLS